MRRPASLANCHRLLHHAGPPVRQQTTPRHVRLGLGFASGKQPIDLLELADHRRPLPIAVLAEHGELGELGEEVVALGNDGAHPEVPRRQSEPLPLPMEGLDETGPRARLGAARHGLPVDAGPPDGAPLHLAETGAGGFLVRENGSGRAPPKHSMYRKRPIMLRAAFASRSITNLHTRQARVPHSLPGTVTSTAELGRPVLVHPDDRVPAAEALELKPAHRRRRKSAKRRKPTRVTRHDDHAGALAWRLALWRKAPHKLLLELLLLDLVAALDARLGRSMVKLAQCLAMFSPVRDVPNDGIHGRDPERRHAIVDVLDPRRPGRQRLALGIGDVLAAPVKVLFARERPVHRQASSRLENRQRLHLGAARVRSDDLLEVVAGGTVVVALVVLAVSVDDDVGGGGHFGGHDERVQGVEFERKIGEIWFKKRILLGFERDVDVTPNMNIFRYILTGDRVLYGIHSPSLHIVFLIGRE
ncbi:hypothetical protein BC828DRAFT_276635 [Blastocladiella britannica]|nr:hypothetical protein BC828DRAFT_276635 [Blastocladiella britannica]